MLGSYYNVTKEAGVFPPMSNVYIFNPGRISLFCYENAKHYRALVGINCKISAEIRMLRLLSLLTAHLKFIHSFSNYYYLLLFYETKSDVSSQGGLELAMQL